MFTTSLTGRTKFADPVIADVMLVTKRYWLLQGIVDPRPEIGPGKSEQSDSRSDDKQRHADQRQIGEGVRAPFKKLCHARSRRSRAAPDTPLESRAASPSDCKRH